jgi:hypothetical protein
MLPLPCSSTPRYLNLVTTVMAVRRPPAAGRVHRRRPGQALPLLAGCAELASATHPANTARRPAARTALVRACRTHSRSPAPWGCLGRSASSGCCSSRWISGCWARRGTRGSWRCCQGAPGVLPGAVGGTGGVGGGGKLGDADPGGAAPALGIDALQVSQLRSSAQHLLAHLRQPRRMQQLGPHQPTSQCGDICAAWCAATLRQRLSSSGAPRWPCAPGPGLLP